MPPPTKELSIAPAYSKLTCMPTNAGDTPKALAISGAIAEGNSAVVAANVSAPVLAVSTAEVCESTAVEAAGLFTPCEAGD
jgi:hypothetical protein